MDVERAAGESVGVDAREDAHEAGVADEPDLAAVELAHQRRIEFLTRDEILGIQPQRLDTGGTRAVQRRRFFAIGDHDNHARGEVRCRGRVEQRLEVAATTRDEDRHVKPRGIHAASRLREGACVCRPQM